MTKVIISHENNISPQELSIIKAQAALLANYKTSDIVSHETRMLDPKVQPFFEDWKQQQKWQNTPQETAKNTYEPVRCDIIKDNESVLPEVPSYYLDETYVEMCNKYHIPYKLVYHSYRELDATEEEIADYADLLKDARSLGIYWDTSTYDPEGLQEAIDEYHDEEADHDYFASARADSWDYYSRSGV